MSKKWHRYQLRRGSLQTSSNRSNFFNTSTTVVPRLRGSIPSGTDRLETSCLSNGTSSRSDRSSTSPPKALKINGILKVGDNRGASTRVDVRNDSISLQLIKEDANSNEKVRVNNCADDEGRHLMTSEVCGLPAEHT